MKFIAISDTHCRHKSLKLPKGDAIIHAGDVTYKGEPHEVLDFLHWFGGLNFTYKIFIAGNHDFYFEKATPAALQSLMPKDVIYLNDSGVTINNIKIWGSPVTPWFYNWAFNKPRGPAIDRHWQLIPADTDILVTHGPAYGILDNIINGSNAGDRDLRKRIEAIKPKVHICGHIHESYGSTKWKGTHFINATVLNESYELVNPPVVFNL